MSAVNMRIDDATPDTNVTGVEKFPVSDAGVAKCTTISQVKDYTISQIAAIASASGVDISSDGVYLLKGNSIKPLSASALATAILDYGFGKAAVASMNGNEIVGVKDSSTQKTITVSQLKTWLQENMTVTTDINIGTKASAGALSGSDLLVVAQSGTNKKLTLTTLSYYVHVAFKDYVTSLTNVTTLTDSDVFYIINGTESKKCTVSQLKTIIGAGDVMGPSSTTNNNVPQWDSTTKKLKDGLSVQGTVRASGTASSNAIPTEAAVRAAIAEVQSPVSSVNSKTGVVVLTGTDIPVSGSDATKIDAKLSQLASMNVDFIGATQYIQGTHGLVPAPSSYERNKFLKADGTWSDVPADVNGPLTTTENKIPQWDNTQKKLKDGLSVVTTVSASPSDTNIPTEKAVSDHVESIGNEMYSVFPFVSNTFTNGQIPIIGNGIEGVPHIISSGKSVVESIGATPSNNNIPTELAVSTSLASKPTASLVTSVSAESTDAQVPSAKAVNDFVDKKVLLEKISGSFSNNSGTIVNHAIQRFGITTGTNYTLTLPSSVTNRSREFYVVFSQAPAPSGSTSFYSEITFANPSGETVEIHGKNGVLSNNKISLEWDATGSSNAYHVYHFFEDNSQLWCVNVFEFEESGLQDEDKYAIVNATTTIMASGGRPNIEPIPGVLITYTLDSSRMSFSIDFDENIHRCKDGGWYEFNFEIVNGQNSQPTVTVPNVSRILLPSGVSTVGEMFKSNKRCSFRMMYLVDFNDDDERYCSECVITPMGECAIQ